MLLAPGTAAETATLEAGGVPAGLVYSSDAEPGFVRIRRGGAFACRDSQGRWPGTGSSAQGQGLNAAETRVVG